MQVSLAVCLLVPLGLLEGWQALKNDATEVIPELAANARPPEEPAHNNTMNRAKYGGRYQPRSPDPKEASDFRCREQHFTRYVTDGPCRSTKPMKELVCSGQCVPAYLLPNSIGRGKWWRQSATDYRCVPAHSRAQRIQLVCPGEANRTYKYPVVTSCRCKRYTRSHNQSQLKDLGKDALRPPKNKKPRLPRVKSNVHHELENTY
ncbi:sclerostin [Microcaecilia unicolor]|uniref:Sclerostin n=1 Tax=Microcaecilia unicolor TaxID=1415580 RepID=A0A6P7ZDE5_9AMPH|nr:sclerostin [Microcaecilia unicolor]